MSPHPPSVNLTSNLSGVWEESHGHCGDMMVGVIAWASVSALCSLVGCPACAAVFWKLLQRHRAGTSMTPNDVFMLNLTVMDVVFLLAVPFGLCNFFLWELAAFQMFTNFVYAFNLAGRPLLTACICLDCYLAVVHPVTYRANKSLAPRVIMAAGVWTVTVTQGSAAAVLEELNHSPWAMFVYAIALPIIIVCDASILWSLKNSFRGGRELHPKKKKALQVITNSMVMTFTSYFPPVLVYILGRFMISDDKAFDCFLGIPILIAPTAGSAIMPLLYLDNLGSFNNPCCSA